MSRPATSRLKVNPAIGTMPVLQYCTPEQLLIDDSYQRTLETGPSQTLVRRIAMFWDWSLCQPLIVARRNDGGHYVVDGQHRLAAAKLRGDIFQLPCVVASYASMADEAASFVALNQQRRPLGALDLFKAALAAGDTEAMSIMKAIIDAGLSLSNHMNTVLMNADRIRRLAREADEEELAAQAEIEAQERRERDLERLTSPSAVLRLAQRDWPAQCRDVSAIANELGISLGECWRRVIKAGVDCLRDCEGEAAI
jgi:hypothetical protein